MRPTDVSDPEYFHKVVDCQYACPAHTPVPEYIRLIEVQKQKSMGSFKQDQIWYRGQMGIYNFRLFDARTGTLHTAGHVVGLGGFFGVFAIHGGSRHRCDNGGWIHGRNLNCSGRRRVGRHGGSLGLAQDSGQQ